MKTLIKVLPLLIFAGIVAATRPLEAWTRISGVWTLVWFSVVGISGLVAIRCLLVSILLFDAARGFLQKCILFVSTLCMMVVALEMVLSNWPRFADAKNAAAVMPDALSNRFIHVDGARKAYFWQGHLHVKDAEGMRRATPFPDRQPGLGRIVVVGDSMTYGQGVDATNAFPAVLERLLQRDGFNVEVLNLGIMGKQSAEILRKVQFYVPRLNPDLVIYGICLNDFLDEGMREYTNNMAAQLPLPKSWKKFLFTRTRCARLACAGYDGVLMKIGVRTDFFGDILKDMNNRQARFASDVKKMNECVRSNGLPPMISITIDPQPVNKGPGHRIAQIAEQATAAAGFEVVSTADFYVKYSGKDFSVSPWEHHPNEEAYAILARLLHDRMVTNPALAPFRTVQ